MITKKDIYGWNTSYRPNTFIGGVGTTISTKSLLATKLGISTTRIKSFRIVNDEVQACIEGNYSIGASVWSNNNELTHYHDIDGLITGTALNAIRNCANLVSINFPKCTILGLSCFYNCVKLTTVLLPELIEVGTSSLQNCSQLTMLDLPKVTYVGPFGLSNNPLLAYVNLPSVTNLGGSVLYNNVFQNVKAGCIVNVSMSMMTNNNGLPDGDLQSTLLDVNYVDYTNVSSNFNTEVGGVASTINTRRLIGNLLGVTSSRIVDFSIVSSDIKFRVLGTYTLPSRIFENNSLISKYLDHDGLVTAAGTRVFYNATNLTSVLFPSLISAAEGTFAFTGLQTITLPSLTEIGNQMFNGCPHLKYVNLPILVNCTGTSHFLNNTSLEEVHLPMIDKLGNSVVANTIFSGVKSGCKVYVPQSMMIINSGMPDGDLTNILLDVVYLGYVDNYDNYNTEIGGLSAIYDTRFKIGVKLGIGSARIVDFSIVNSDIKFRVLGTYTMSTSAFMTDASITNFKDNSGLCTLLNNNSFAYATNLSEVYFPAVTTLQAGGGSTSGVFNDCPNLHTVYMPLLANINGRRNFANTPMLTSMNLDNVTSIINTWTFGGSAINHINLPLATSLGQEFMNVNTLTKTFTAPLATTFSVRAFEGGQGLETINIPAVENIPVKNQNFHGLLSLKMLNAKKLKYMGDPTTINGNGASSAFSGLKMNCVIQVHIDMATVNSGTADTSLIWCKTNRNATVEFYDDNGNYVSTL